MAERMETMEKVIKDLFDAIQEKQEKFVFYKEIFGEDDVLTKITLHELNGMEEAFQLVAGMSFTQYLISATRQLFKSGVPHE